MAWPFRRKKKVDPKAILKKRGIRKLEVIASGGASGDIYRGLVKTEQGLVPKIYKRVSKRDAKLEAAGFDAKSALDGIDPGQTVEIRRVDPKTGEADVVAVKINPITGRAASKSKMETDLTRVKSAAGLSGERFVESADRDMSVQLIDIIDKGVEGFKKEEVIKTDKAGNKVKVTLDKLFERRNRLAAKVKEAREVGDKERTARLKSRLADVMFDMASIGLRTKKVQELEKRAAEMGLDMNNRADRLELVHQIATEQMADMTTALHAQKYGASSESLRSEIETKKTLLQKGENQEALQNAVAKAIDQRFDETAEISRRVNKLRREYANANDTQRKRLEAETVKLTGDAKGARSLLEGRKDIDPYKVFRWHIGEWKDALTSEVGKSHDLVRLTKGKYHGDPHMDQFTLTSGMFDFDHSMKSNLAADMGRNAASVGFAFHNEEMMGYQSKYLNGEITEAEYKKGMEKLREKVKQTAVDRTAKMTEHYVNALDRQLTEGGPDIDRLVDKTREVTGVRREDRVPLRAAYKLTPKRVKEWREARQRKGELVGQRVASGINKLVTKRREAKAKRESLKPKSPLKRLKETTMGPKKKKARKLAV